MRIIFRLSEEEARDREERLARDPDEFTDGPVGDLAESIWELPGEIPADGVDLEAPDGTYLYTIVGEPRE